MASFIITAVSLTLLLFCQSYAEKPYTGFCQFKKYHSDHQLESVNRISGLIGKSYTSVHGKWSYTVGICADLKKDGVGDAGAFQQLLDGDGKVDSKHNIGSLTNTHLMAGSDWAVLEYKDGEKYKTHCQGQDKRTVVLLNCDESIGDDDAKMIHIEEESNIDEGCYYLFEMKHKALCPVSSGGVLSIGSILLIVFFSVAGLYLLVGFIYQRFILGSKGREQIPNYEFWKDLGNLEADGCDFVFRSRGRQNTGFRGIGDDQLDSEEIRDDNLLPM